jgi:hypothetical protein
MSRQRSAQLKIGNLEKQVVSILEKLHGGKDIPAISEVDFNETIRKKKPAGYYFFTIQERGNEAHGIIIEKRVSPKTGKAAFYLFDPNGQQWANASGYRIGISVDGKTVKPSITLSPKTSWNPMGYCALWCIVAGIFLANVRNSIDEDLPFGPADKARFYTFMDKNGGDFIEDIYKNLILNHRGDYSSASQARVFVDAILGKILLAI